jgi:bacteriorhodopsin
MVETWLWIGSIGMTVGLVLVLGLARSLPAVRRHHATVSAFVLVIAALAYFAMANGQGTVQVGDRVVYYARYIDWAFTTPLLLLGLVTVALPRLTSPAGTRERNALVGTIIGADLLMIVTGAVAAMTQDDAVRYAWFAFGCVAFLVVLWAIFFPLRASARQRSPQHAALYNRLLWVLTALWFVYPVVWVLGTEGSGVVGLSTEVAIFAVVDLLAKVGFGLLLVTGLTRLPRSESTVAPFDTARAA